METVSDVQFVLVYVVRKVHSTSRGYYISDIKNEDKPKVDKIHFDPLYPTLPPTIVEVFADEVKAAKRAEELTDKPNTYSYMSSITTKKHLAVTIDNGKTVSLLDCINTFEVKA